MDDEGQSHQQPAEPTLVDLHVILLGTWKNARVCTERSTKSSNVHTLSALDVVSLPESRRCPKTRPFGSNAQSTVIRMVSLGDGARPTDSRPIVIIILPLDVCLSDESVPREMTIEFLEVVVLNMFFFCYGKLL